MQRVALITGASSGIGLALAHMLAEEGFALTVVSRRADKLAVAEQELAAAGATVLAVAANLADDAEIARMISEHREHYGRLDVLVNNAGVGIGQAAGDITERALDLQLGTNLRAPILAYREALPLLQAAAQEHGVARVINTSSITALYPQAWLSVYSATKAAVRSLTTSMNKELSTQGIHSTALCPGYVETPMTEFAQGHVPAEQMIRPADIAEAVRMLLRLSPACIVPEIPFVRPGEALL